MEMLVLALVVAAVDTATEPLLLDFTNAVVICDDLASQSHQTGSDSRPTSTPTLCSIIRDRFNHGVWRHLHRDDGAEFYNGRPDEAGHHRRPFQMPVPTIVARLDENSSTDNYYSIRTATINHTARATLTASSQSSLTKGVGRLIREFRTSHRDRTAFLPNAWHFEHVAEIHELWPCVIFYSPTPFFLGGVSSSLK